MSRAADASTSAARMPVSAHLREARRRTLRASAAVIAGAVSGWFLSELVLDALREPIEALAASRSASLNYDSVTGAFDLRLRIALTTGIVIAAPVWLYEIFAFLAPGLTRTERKYSIGFLAAAVPLFAAGCVTGFLVFPRMVELLAGFAGDADSTILQASSYVDFVLKIVVAMGTAFVLPVFLVVLNLMGVLSARAIRSAWRPAIVAIVVFAALVTPAADVLSMVFVAVPMIVLYGIALLIAAIHDRRRDGQADGHDPQRNDSQTHDSQSHDSERTPSCSV